MKRVQIQDDEEANVSDDGEGGNKKLREHAVCELSSSQESSSTQSAKEILRRRIEQKRVQQNEERFSRSQDNTAFSNWATILSNLLPIIALITEQSRVRFIFTKTFLGTATSRGIFKIFTPQVSQAHCYSCYKTKSTLRTSISTVVEQE